MRRQTANEARSGELAITNLISNKREWNNCFINCPRLDIAVKFTEFYFK